MYGVALVRCLVTFLLRDANSLVQIIKSIMHFWPKTFHTKQIYFISSFTEYFPFLSKLQGDSYLYVIKKMCFLISQCINNIHINVCEVAFSLWQHGGFTSLFFKNPQFLFPLLIPAILAASKTHWSYDVKTSALSLMRNLKEINEEEYNNVISNCSKDDNSQNAENSRRSAFWAHLGENSLNPEENEKLLNLLDPIYSGNSTSAPINESTNLKKLANSRDNNNKSHSNVIVSLQVLKRRGSNGGDKTPTVYVPKTFSSQTRLRNISRPLMSTFLVKN